MPEPFDSRAYDPYSTDLIPDRDLIARDRQAVYEALCAQAPSPRHWMTWLLGIVSLGASGWVTWPWWRQVVVALWGN
jgi:hypothetical protein